MLPALEAELGPGIAEALARTAELARDDADLLDALAADADPGTDTLDCAELAALPAALRTRVIRRWLIRHGATEVTAAHVAWSTRWSPTGTGRQNSPARCQRHPSGWESALPA